MRLFAPAHIYRDRDEAAHQLADRLQGYRGRHPLVLGIPRGAVPMARIVAEALQGDFDVVLVRKLCAPQQPELAVGAVDETGWTFLSPYAESYGADAAYLAEEKQRQMQTMAQRRARYTRVREPIDPEGRVVIVVDDGLATGATMLAALHGLRSRHPARLICAVPVASLSALEAVRPLADDVVCLQTPAGFDAVGQYYLSFPQVDDDEVEALLKS